MPAPRQITTQAIILRRVNFGEADRILTLLTPDQGKLSAIAKGARKAKSKLAGGLELFSVSEISFIKGKNEIDTLTSTRLEKHFGNIVKDLARSDAGYEFIKLIDKATEDKPEEAFFNILSESFIALNDDSIDPLLTQLWFSLHLLRITGHAPNLYTDISGEKLKLSKKYRFHLNEMIFEAGERGEFKTSEVKFLRLALAAERPHLLQRVQDAAKQALAVQPLVQSMVRLHLHL